MGQACIVKTLLACFVICSIVCYIVEHQMGVKAESETALANSDIVEQQVIETEGNKEAETKTINWTDIKNILSSIFTEMLGAFLGFLSAIVLTNRSNRKQMKELDFSLQKELQVIHEELEGRLKNEFEDYYRYQTPIWDINLESGTLALVSSSKVYNKYIQIYSKIQYAQELELEYIHTKLFKETNKTEDFAKRYIDTIDNARRREAKNIHDYIGENILEESGNARRNYTIGYNRQQ